MLSGVQTEDSAGQARAVLFTRLRARSTEIEQAVLTRVRAIADPDETDEPEYLDGFRAAVPAAIGYGLAAIESGEKQAPPVPVVLLTQARVAARHSVSLDTMMRRYVAGREELDRFLVEEVEQVGPPTGVKLTSLLGSQSVVFGRLLAELGEEYKRESVRRVDSPQARLAERVRRLLAGEPLDTSDLDYNFGNHHLGLVAEGDRAQAAIRALAKTLDARLLLVRPGGDSVWAWLGTRQLVERDQLNLAIESSWPEGAPVAFGETGAALAGWRLTHKQARDVFPIALRDRSRVTRYAEVGVAAAMRSNHVLSDSLRQLYIAPIEDAPLLLETLQAYFAAGRNGNAAAAALDVSRQTVSNRLQSVEERIGRPLLVCATDLELALRLEDRELI
jgi:DNA-binding Lrp family transcriptional regulator